jgi:hypothetical protein
MVDDEPRIMEVSKTNLESVGHSAAGQAIGGNHLIMQLIYRHMRDEDVGATGELLDGMLLCKNTFWPTAGVLYEDFFTELPEPIYEKLCPAVSRLPIVQGIYDPPSHASCLYVPLVGPFCTLLELDQDRETHRLSS